MLNFRFCLTYIVIFLVSIKIFERIFVFGAFLVKEYKYISKPDTFTHGVIYRHGCQMSFLDHPAFRF